MTKIKSLLILTVSLTLFVSCTSDKEKAARAEKELWIYTSLYKDTIADLTPRLKEAFPGVKFNWFQAGSEEIATKLNAEIASGTVPKADILISSDRFWYEEMGALGKLHKFVPTEAANIPTTLKNKDGFYHTLSIPVMVLCYNSDAVNEVDAPKSFKELMAPKWKKMFTTGSPLASGTNFTTVAMLQHTYGWDFIKALRSNETISQGGNSAVLRRIQSKERPVGWVLLENILRFKGKDDRLKVIYPDDGVVIQSNVIAITKKEGSRELAQKFVNWMYKKEGQEAMTRSFMYSPLEKYAPPVGAPPFAQLKGKSFPWTDEFISKVVKSRVGLKEKFAEIMFE